MVQNGTTALQTTNGLGPQVKNYYFAMSRKLKITTDTTGMSIVWLLVKKSKRQQVTQL
jgi:hypothetical protein